MRRDPEPAKGMLRPGRRKAWVSREGRTRSPWRPFACTPGAGIVRRSRVTAPPWRNVFHHLAPVFPQELKTSTCWDVSTASRGEGKTRAGVETPAPLPPQHFTGHGTHRGSSAPCWFLVLLEEGAQAAWVLHCTHPRSCKSCPCVQSSLVPLTSSDEVSRLVMVHPHTAQG